jgi:Amiloride-sensitive sodium channel
LDFVISIGGVFGLFFGFSFLSIFEILYKIYELFRDKLCCIDKKPERVITP